MYKKWKNELRTHWTTHGNARFCTPAEFQYREYEWRWLLTSEFNNPRKQAVSRANAQNWQRNTRNHHGGSRPFPVFMDEAAKEHPEVNRYVYTYEKAYPDAQEDIAKVKEASDEVMRVIVRETWPDTQEEEMSEAMSQIDTSDPTIGARIMGIAFPPRANNFCCRGIGKKGEGVLKTTLGFQRKATSTSNRITSMTTRTTQLESEVHRLPEQQAAQAACNASHAAYVAEIHAIQQAQQQQMFQYMQDFTAAQLQGLSAPPMPTAIPLPQPPQPPQQPQKRILI